MIGRQMLRSARMHRARFVVAAVSVLLPACSNSPEDHPPLYPVRGKVVRNGKPMPVGTVLFEYAGNGPNAPKGVGGGPFRATAKIHEGSFTLNGYAGAAGMPAGNYKVGILATQGRSENLLSGREIVLPRTGKSAVRTDHYADPASSGLSAVVKEENNDLPPFELK